MLTKLINEKFPMMSSTKDKDNKWHFLKLYSNLKLKLQALSWRHKISYGFSLILMVSLILYLHLCPFLINADNAIFYPSQLIYDTNGNKIEAHAGYILKVKNTYFWYGESVKEPPDWLSDGINLYTSQNLMQWNYRGMIFTYTQIVNFPITGQFRIERPKVLYNEKYNNYVLLFHVDIFPFKWPSIGVASSKSPYGPFKWKHYYQPLGKSSFDMTVFKEDDGTAYLINSVDNERLAISKLTDDYLSVGKKCGEFVGNKEAPAVFKFNNMYYMVNSDLKGWYPTKSDLYASSDGICSYNWKKLGNLPLGDGANTTFESQPSFIFKYKFKDGNELMLFWGDRWDLNGALGLLNATYVTLPLIKDPIKDGFRLLYYKQWKLSDFHPDKGKVYRLNQKRIIKAFDRLKKNHVLH